MGSSSVYCQISRIAINEGDDCVLVPMSKPESQLSYRVYQVTDRWLPLTLPVFGKYNDYQGMEHVEKSINTELIERITGIDIDTFAGNISNNNWHEKELKEYGEVRPCWILRDVWNLMNHIDSDAFFDLGLSDVMGHDDLLLRLGFKPVKDIGVLTHPGDLKRFKKAYELDGEIVWSDGKWLYEKPWTRKKFLDRFPSVNKDVLFSSPIRLMSKHDLSYKLSLIQISEYMVFFEGIATKFEKFKAEEGEDDTDTPRTPMSDAYWSEIKSGNTFMLDLFYELYCVFINMGRMSCIFEPMLDYIAPQCGEHKEHLRFANEFTKILNDKVRERKG
jgi:hypothetical protein